MKIIMGEKELNEAIVAWASAHGITKSNLSASWHFEQKPDGTMRLDRIELSVIEKDKG